MSKSLFLSLVLIIGITTLAQPNITNKNFPEIPKKIFKVEPAPEQLEAWQKN